MVKHFPDGPKTFKNKLFSVGIGTLSFLSVLLTSSTSYHTEFRDREPLPTTSTIVELLSKNKGRPVHRPVGVFNPLTDAYRQEFLIDIITPLDKQLAPKSGAYKQS